MEKRIHPKLYLRKDKIDANGRMPLFIRFRRIDGKEPKFSMGNIRLPFDEYDSSVNLPKDEFLRLEVEKELHRIEKEILHYRLEDIPITFDKLKEIVKGKSSQEDDLFVDYYEEYLDMQEKNGKMRPSSIKSHISLIQALNEFNRRLRVKDINACTITKFIDFLQKRNAKRKKKAKDLSFSKRLSQIRTVIRYIASRNIPIQDPFRSGEIYIKPCGRCETYLNESELSKMIQMFLGKNLSVAEHRILMMYLLACTTGIRISDMRCLHWENINLECRNGVIVFCCKKTQRNNYISLSPLAKDMLCYSPEGDIGNVERDKTVFVKVYSPTKINTTLKALAKKAGISKNITFHSARRTFATLCNTNDVPFEMIQQLMGHKPTNVTARYCQWNIEEADKMSPKLSFFDMGRFAKLA